jgi:hypothetical protein
MGDSYYKYEQALKNIYAVAYGQQISFVDIYIGQGFTVELYYVTTKPTTDIKEYSEATMYAPVYYVEDEDDCFVYVSGTWVSLSAELQMQNGGAITDISQATTSYHYYALVDNGWKEYFAPEGSVTIVANGTFDVKEKAEVVVNVENKIPDGYIKPSGNLEITENGTFDVTDKSSVTIEVESESTGGDAIIQVDNIGARYGFKVDLGDIALPYTTTQINNIRIEEA